MFNIGKAEEIMFYNKVNTYPASTDRINNNIDENKTDLSNPNDWSAQGFPGIDYMMHGIESTKQAIVDKYNNESKYGVYLKTLVNDMSANTEPAKKLVLGSANGSFLDVEEIKEDMKRIEEKLDKLIEKGR